MNDILYDRRPTPSADTLNHSIARLEDGPPQHAALGQDVDHADQIVAEARSLRAAGFALARIAPGQKVPVDAGWQRGASPSPEAFVAGGRIHNLAIVCGPASAGAVCVDLDGIDMAVAEQALPPTAMQDYREGRLGGHWWYRLRPERFPDYLLPASTTLVGGWMSTGQMERFPGTQNLRVKGNNQVGVEFRGAGAHTVVPPSMTVTGPRLWRGGRRGDPALIDAEVLLGAVERVARQVGWRGRGRGGGLADSDQRTQQTPGSDAMVLARAQGAANRGKFMRIWNETAAKSEDDAALVSMLAFWTRDPRQIERLWLASPCGQRLKTHSRADYRERTIRFVLEARHADR